MWTWFDFSINFLVSNNTPANSAFFIIVHIAKVSWLRADRTPSDTFGRAATSSTSAPFLISCAGNFDRLLSDWLFDFVCSFCGCLQTKETFVWLVNLICDFIGQSVKSDSFSHCSGAPTRAKRAWDRAPYPLWSTSFPLVVTWLTEHTYVRTYASTDCTGGVG